MCILVCDVRVYCARDHRTIWIFLSSDTHTVDSTLTRWIPRKNHEKTATPTRFILCLCVFSRSICFYYIRQLIVQNTNLSLSLTRRYTKSLSISTICYSHILVPVAHSIWSNRRNFQCLVRRKRTHRQNCRLARFHRSLATSHSGYINSWTTGMRYQV